ncbi:hypothetical protein GR183_21015 [Stappia sp. GBMRC 2046]|uniref:Sulfotransferase family protein n=1 Tax=Stappia sediminis TaxID=2692190 RepID=A0A7X3S9X8_9HYPH|nr:sulfotransferase family 2 domain-containing protein [Stappia sediminis]MXN67396.1 hypothetical protein [Stappia sediminis]
MNSQENVSLAKKFLLKTTSVRFPYFLFIPKNGCSYIKNSLLLERDKRVGIENLDLQDVHREAARHLSLKHVEYRDFLSEQPPVPVVIRNPYERLASAFLQKFVTSSKNTPVVRKMEALIGMSIPDVTFSGFVEKYADIMMEGRASEIDPHFLPQSYFLDGISNPVIFDLEEVDEALRLVESQPVKDPVRTHSVRERLNNNSAQFEGALQDIPHLTVRELHKNLREGVRFSYNDLFDRESYERLKEVFDADLILSTLRQTPHTKPQSTANMQNSRRGAVLANIIGAPGHVTAKTLLKQMAALEKSAYRREALEKGAAFIKSSQKPLATRSERLIWNRCQRLALSLTGDRVDLGVSREGFGEGDDTLWTSIELLEATINRTEYSIPAQLHQELTNYTIAPVFLVAAYLLDPSRYRDALLERVMRSIGSGPRFQRIKTAEAQSLIQLLSLIGNRTVLSENTALLGLQYLLGAKLDARIRDSGFFATLVDQALSAEGYQSIKLIERVESAVAESGGRVVSSLLLARGYHSYLNGARKDAAGYFQKANERANERDEVFFHFNNGVRTFYPASQEAMEAGSFLKQYTPVVTSAKDRNAEDRTYVLTVGADDGYFSKFFLPYIDAIAEQATALAENERLVVSCICADPSADSVKMMEEIGEVAASLPGRVEFDLGYLPLPDDFKTKSFYTCLRFIALPRLSRIFGTARTTVMTTDIDIRCKDIVDTFRMLSNYDIGVRLAGNPDWQGADIVRGRPWMINAQMVCFSGEALSLVAEDFAGDIISKFPSERDLWMVDQSCLRMAVDRAVERIPATHGHKPRVRNLMRGLNVLESSGWDKDAFAEKYSSISLDHIAKKLAAAG